MASKNDLLKREAADQRKLADHWKLQHDEYRKLNARLTARVEELEDALEGVLWMAEEWFDHTGSNATLSDDYKRNLEAARAALTKGKSNDH